MNLYKNIPDLKKQVEQSTFDEYCSEHRISLPVSSQAMAIHAFESNNFKDFVEHLLEFAGRAGLKVKVHSVLEKDQIDYMMDKLVQKNMFEEVFYFSEIYSSQLKPEILLRVKCKQDVLRALEIARNENLLGLMVDLLSQRQDWSRVLIILQRHMSKTEFCEALSTCTSTLFIEYCESQNLKVLREKRSLDTKLRKTKKLKKQKEDSSDSLTPEKERDYENMKRMIGRASVEFEHTDKLVQSNSPEMRRKYDFRKNKL